MFGQPYPADCLPDGHLGFAPIETGSFRTGCHCEPDLICADSHRYRADTQLHSRRARPWLPPDIRWPPAKTRGAQPSAARWTVATASGGTAAHAAAPARPGWVSGPQHGFSPQLWSKI